MVKDIKKRIFLFRKRMLYRLRAIKKVLSLLKMRKAIIKWYDRNSNLAIFQNHGQSNVSSGWSVVVVTDGKSPESLEKLIKSVDSELHDVPSEIIVVGRNSLPLNFKPIMEVRHIPYKELGLSPGWITFKKNIGAKVSKYDKLVMCHDYVYFMPGWKAGFDKFGYDFDVCMNKITDFEGERHLDWVANIPGIGKGLLPYHTEFTKYQYGSFELFIFAIRFCSYILTNTCPPNLSFIK